MSREFPRSMLASFLVHGVVIAFLFTLRIHDSVRESAPHPRQVTLIVPSVRPASRPVSKPRVSPRAFVQIPIPIPRPEPEMQVELPVAPILETPRLSIPPLEPSHAIELPAPLLKTDNLPDARPRSASGPARQTFTATGGFGPATTSERAAVRGTVNGGGFGDAVFAAPPVVQRQTAASSILTPVEIISKPHPAYTEEARRLRMEGEVLVEVLFAASGEASVVRVLRGMGHGLDESAAAAAREIRFHPAQRDGVPIDSLAVVHIRFQLAY